MPVSWQDWLEAFAVAAGLCYVVLAIRGQRSCWIAGLLSTLAYGVLCQVAGLRLQGALQVLYAVLAVVGWWEWRQQPDAADKRFVVRRLPWRGQAAALVSVAALSWAGHGLLAASGSAQPWLESITTAGGLVATWLAARKWLDNWSWWIVINGATAWLYWEAALRPTAGLYLAYATLAVLGWREWRKQLA